MAARPLLPTPQKVASVYHVRQATRASYLILILILLLALPLRIYWMITQTPVISLEGSEYVRMAERLAERQGLVGNFEGPETMYAPLFPILTAGVYYLAGNAERAAHLVCLTFGVALLVPVFLIADMMYGKRVAHISAVLVAIHPVLIKVSASIYNENVYLFLLMMSIYWGLRCLEFQRKIDYVLLGLCLGLAYLTRPEAFAYPAFFVLAVWIVALATGHIGWKPAIGSCLIVAVFLIMALPYARFFHRHIGQMRFEGKWNINYTIAMRIRSGMDYAKAAYGLGPDNSVQGPLLDPFHFAAYTPFPHSLYNKGQALLFMATRNWRLVYQYLESSTIGFPFLFGLVLIGLFRKSWNPRRLLQESVVLAMAASILLLTLTAPLWGSRYMLALLPLSSVWAGKGIVELTQWSKAVLASFRARGLPKGTAIGIAVPTVLLALIFAVSWYGTREDGLFVFQQARNLDIKKAGIWLRLHTDGSKRVACNSTVLTYYSKATIIGLPYAPSAQALSYVSAKHPDFIILDGSFAASFPEEKEWIEHGIPDSRAQLLYRTGSKSSNEIQIYRWHDL